MKLFFSTSTGTKNTDSNSDTIAFTTKNTKFICICHHFISKSSQNDSVKNLKVQFIGTNIKPRVRLKIRQRGFYIFSNETLQDLKNCLLWFIQTKIMMQKYIKANDIISQMVLLTVLTSPSTENYSIIDQLILI